MNYEGGEEMTLAERMIMYRAKHKLTQREMGVLINESLNMIFKKWILNLKIELLS